MQYKQLNKDFYTRKRWEKTELRRFLYNYLKQNKFLPAQNRKEIKTHLLSQEGLRKSQLKNMCLTTGLTRSVITTFNASRHVFKKTAAQKNYPGVRKAS